MSGEPEAIMARITVHLLEVDLTLWLTRPDHPLEKCRIHATHESFQQVTRALFDALVAPPARERFTVAIQIAEGGEPTRIAFNRTMATRLVAGYSEGIEHCMLTLLDYLGAMTRDVDTAIRVWAGGQ